jgi:hypothetical protein
VQKSRHLIRGFWIESEEGGKAIDVLRLPVRLYEVANWTEEDGTIVSEHFNI